MSYANMVNAYPGVSLYDRELLLEHMSSPSFYENYRCNWGIGETAIAGQTFINIPQGFTSRTAFPFIRYFKLIDPNCFMHHLANNYADSHYNLLTPDRLFISSDDFPKNAS